MSADAWLTRIQRSVRRDLQVAGVLLLILLLVVGGIAGYWWYRWEYGPSAPNVERALATEGPPAGSTPKEVEAWLDSHHWPHPRGYEPAPSASTFSYMERETPAEVYGSDVSGLGGVVHAEVPDAVFSESLSGELAVYFFFNKEDRLIRHVVKEWHGDV